VKAFISALLAVGCLLALPGMANAATYTVNSTGDAPDNGAPNGVCETVMPGECTLRAAITEANSSSGVSDEIDFAASFNGQIGDTITAASALPTIVDELEIHGGSCDTAAGVQGPCAGVLRAGTGLLLVVEDDDVEIQGLAVMGATTAINVLNASEGFVAKGNWIGFDLTGATLGNGNGIFIDPGSDGATIGGTEAAERNVIGGNAAVGLDLEGASDATIQGNYFGVTPKGDAAAANPTNIEVTDSTSNGGIPAENNEIGNTLEGAALTSPICDGGCNVISGATGRGIDLNGAGLGEEPASGQTTIHGNFVGLDAAGTTVIANAGIGIWAGGADHVLVGAPLSSALDPERNYIAGGSEGVVSESGSNDFVARGNSVGFASDGTDVAPPASKGIFVLALNVTEDASVENNDVRMAGGVGIEYRFSEGRIIGNDVEGGSVGIWTLVEPGGGLIAGNVVEAPTEFGILVESPNTEVRRNSVFDSGGAGIRVRNPPGVAMTGGRIGGDTEESENVIEGSEGPAIEIFEAALEPGSTTEIARNRGSSNDGLFIDLVAGANEGILPPAISTGSKTEASGTAEPEATVRVFRKATAETGEIESFLGEAEADSSGEWKVTYPSIPGDTIIAATQTSEEKATSELATAKVPADPDTCADTPSMCVQPTCADTPSMCVQPDLPVLPCPAAPGGCNPSPTSPQTTITKAPKAKSTKTTAKFKFKSSVTGSTFECRLDKKPFKKCKSPKTYKKLKPGKHVFKVRAVGPTGLLDATPAKRAFTVLE
jgi:CSLREA domain-containing protein